MGRERFAAGGRQGGVKRLPLILLVILLSGCDLLSGLASGVDTKNPVRIDTATLLADGRSVRLEFVGGREHSANDPCSREYVGQATIHGDQLDVAVYARIHPNVRNDIACTAEGHFRSVTVQLTEAFHGSRIRDVSGQDLPIATP